jgi:hypothetical protein
MPYQGWGIAIATLFSVTIGTAFVMFITYLPVLLLGLWLLRGAKRLILFAYPEENTNDSTTQNIEVD